MLTFKNARHLWNKAEYDFWSVTEAKGFVASSPSRSRRFSTRGSSIGSMRSRRLVRTATGERVEPVRFERFG